MQDLLLHHGKQLCLQHFHHAVTQLFIERQLLQQNAKVLLVPAGKLKAFTHEGAQKVAESFMP